VKLLFALLIKQNNPMEIPLKTVSLLWWVISSDVQVVHLYCFVF
jgi:hypothetical protein